MAHGQYVDHPDLDLWYPASSSNHLWRIECGHQNTSGAKELDIRFFIHVGLIFYPGFMPGSLFCCCCRCCCCKFSLGMWLFYLADLLSLRLAGSGSS